jgi:hypothetical protein
VSALIEITRDDLVRALNAAQERFQQADASLKSFRFSYPARAEQFEEWKRMRDLWDQCDEEVQSARENLRDFDRGRFSE